MQYICPKCGHTEPTRFEICPHCEIVVEKFHRPSVRVNDRMDGETWYAKGTHSRRIAIFLGGVLVVAFLLATGSVHFVIDSRPLENHGFVQKESFGFAETIVNVDSIVALPRPVAKEVYPIGFRILQREGIIDTDEEIARKLDLQRQLDQANEYYWSIIQRR